MLLAAGPTFAFPERMITLVVPFAPCGSTDIAARVIAEEIAKFRAIVQAAGVRLERP